MIECKPLVGGGGGSGKAKTKGRRRSPSQATLHSLLGPKRPKPDI